MSDPINHKELAISRLAVQYSESINLINYIKTLLLEADILEAVFRSLLEDRWIDTAEGKVLDIIGEIVGQDRELIDASLIDYFGFDDYILANSFGTLSDNTVGGRFRSINEAVTGNRYLTDAEYRKFIKARIFKNKTRSTPEDIISQIKFIFDITDFEFSDGNGEYTITINTPMPNNEKILLTGTDLIPKTIGVAVNYIFT